MTPRMYIVNKVYEAAKDAGDEMIIAACRRLRESDLRGWKRHHSPADYALILEVEAALSECEDAA